MRHISRFSFLAAATLPLITKCSETFSISRLRSDGGVGGGLRRLRDRSFIVEETYFGEARQITASHSASSKNHAQQETEHRQNLADEDEVHLRSYFNRFLKDISMSYHSGSGFDDDVSLAPTVNITNTTDQGGRDNQNGPNLICAGIDVNATNQSGSGLEKVPVQYRYEADMRGYGDVDPVLAAIESAVLDSMAQLLKCSSNQRSLIGGKRVQRRLNVVGVQESSVPSDIGSCNKDSESPSTNTCVSKSAGFVLIVDSTSKEKAQEFHNAAVQIIKNNTAVRGAGVYVDADPRLLDVRYVDQGSNSTSRNGNGATNVPSGAQSAPAQKISAAVWIIVSLGFVAFAFLLERIHKRSWRNKEEVDESPSEFECNDNSLSKDEDSIGATDSERTMQLHSEPSQMSFQSATESSDESESEIDEESVKYCNALPPFAEPEDTAEDVEEMFVNSSNSPSVQQGESEKAPL